MSELARRLLLPSQRLCGTHYFTSRIDEPPDQRKRQATYLDALATLPDVRLHFGHYMTVRRRCRFCGKDQTIQTEKMTDVNIATEMLMDAFTNRYDTALVISADSDLTGPLRRIRQHFSGKRIIVAFPPDRFSVTLQNVAYKSLYIERHHLIASQFPDRVPKSDGFVLVRPQKWR